MSDGFAIAQDHVWVPAVLGPGMVNNTVQKSRRRAVGLGRGKDTRDGLEARTDALRASKTRDVA